MGSGTSRLFSDRKWRYVGLMAQPELFPRSIPRDQSQLSSITVPTWMAGFNLALTAGVLWRVVSH
jgi:hypothetical protein